MRRMIKRDSRFKMFVKKEKKQPRNFIMDILIVIAMLFLFIQIGRFVVEYKNAFDDYVPTVSSMSYYYMEHNYSALSSYYMDYPQMKEKKEYREYCAVSEYYLAGTLYQSCKANGDAEGMKRQKEKMNEAESGMGSLQKSKVDIDKILQIEE